MRYTIRLVYEFELDAENEEDAEDKAIAEITQDHDIGEHLEIEEIPENSFVKTW